MKERFSLYDAPKTLTDSRGGAKPTGASLASLSLRVQGHPLPSLSSMHLYRAASTSKGRGLPLFFLESKCGAPEARTQKFLPVLLFFVQHCFPLK